MSDDPRNNPNHPMSWDKDPVKQGEHERSYGNGHQERWVNGESHDDYQRRITGNR